MARFLPLHARRLLLAKILTSPAAIATDSAASIPAMSGAVRPCRSYITEMHRSAFKENLLRVLRTEIAYEAEIRPPSTPATAFGSFSIEDHDGEQWIRLRQRSRLGEELKIEASMFDGADLSRKPAAMQSGACEARLHITLAVEVSRDEDSERALRFECSAWPDALDVEKVFAVRRGAPALVTYTGPDFKCSLKKLNHFWQLDEELQEAARGFLLARGVDEELAAFLHEYMENKYRSELLRWLSSVEAYVKRK